MDSDNMTIAELRSAIKELAAGVADIYKLTTEIHAKQFKPRANPRRVDPLTDPANEVLNYLNTKKPGKGFKLTDSNRENIKARMREKHGVDDFKAVIDFMVGEWGTDPKMRKYLRPATLFAPSKFDGYLDDALAEKCMPAPVDEWDKIKADMEGM